ncbi:hypothetical protein F8388_006255 [Cannabis sativa]|uniref:Uncharacterized protein n=1 Tax=Cannabis sativa TaxID=3483 RepID=A0A7J6IBA9_CANSA|nr:hypothetical protein F8388_006255 [Cannabis sativa]KAF4404807.1 hypothetical protein G4B88_006193 [Cannabis sativa]
MDYHFKGSSSSDHHDQQIGNGMRSRSFRNEDYNNRRAFLRSYPLQWGTEEEEEGGNEQHIAKEDHHKINYNNIKKKKKKTIKRIIIAMIHWGNDKALVLKRVKTRVTIYVIACIPIVFKPSTTALISA